MFLIGDTLVTLDVLEKDFCCDLGICRGACCIEGDAGAPITEEECTRLEQQLPQLLPLMTKEAREVVQQQGICYLDPSGERVTSIVNGKDCIFARTNHEGWCYCLIEKNKPISCHLYPIRITENGSRVGVEYHRWDICHCGRVKGKKEHIKLYQFLKQPLIRRFGQAWYDELELTAKEWEKQCVQK